MAALVEEESSISKHPPYKPPCLKQTSSRWTNAHHAIETLDDYTLLETVTDIYNENSDAYDDDNKMQHIVMKKLGVDEDDESSHIRHRIEGTIQEVKRHSLGALSLMELPLMEPNEFIQLNDEPSYIIEETPSESLSFKLGNEESKEYDEIGKVFTTKMGQILHANYVHKHELITECIDNDCVKAVLSFSDINKCQCIRRVCVMLDIYHDYKEFLNTSHHTAVIGAYLIYDKLYSYQEFYNDFAHIVRCHLAENESQRFICTEIRKRFECNVYCAAQTRHSRDRTFDINNMERMDQLIFRRCVDKDDDIYLYSQKFFDVHAYFMHSTVHLGTVPMTGNDDIDVESKFAYVGAKEDSLWMDRIADICSEQEIYNTLVESMGVFRWQSAHGFRTNEYKGLSHIKPRYSNIKEEVLHNEFNTIDPNQWNLTLRKCEIFAASYTSSTIRTMFDGHFNDQITGKRQIFWKKGEEMTLPEIVTLKLYTDFDKLQRELKKCFRFESVDEIIEEYCKKRSDSRLSIISPERDGIIHTTSTLKTRNGDNEEKKEKEEHIKHTKHRLEQRLKQFFHWRFKLLLFINKFGSTENMKHCSLYCGINSKMILNPSLTQTFFGPLSTTSSYHVASSFATDKGMVLWISSQFPRLNMCRAFDAALISDYPEEQEFLVGFIYLRIRMVFTKNKVNIPVDSQFRCAFFAIHLFREQMFSMNGLMEHYLISFLQIHLMYHRGIDVKRMNELYEMKDKSQYIECLETVIRWQRNQFDDDKAPKKLLKQGLNKKKCNVLYILTKKFEEFCVEPNLQQILRIDCISEKLQIYFMDKIGIKSYSVSFEKVINIFPYIQEIHFLNWFKFDDAVLKKLIKQIKKKNNKLQQIKFLYYDYHGPLQTFPYFYHPNKLKKKLIQNLIDSNGNKWYIQYPEVNTNRKDGFRIRIRKIKTN